MTSQELRRQFSGAVPLGDQEKFSKAMLQLKQDKERMESVVKVVSLMRRKLLHLINIHDLINIHELTMETGQRENGKCRQSGKSYKKIITPH